MKYVQAICAVAAFLVLGQMDQAIDYKKNVISGAGMTNRATFVSFSSSNFSVNGSNVTSVTTGGPMEATATFGDFDWGDHGFGQKTLDERIHEAEARLNKLIFMRDICPKLEDEIRIAFEKKDLREVLAQVSEILGTNLPYEMPKGVLLVEKSEVYGMPADRFLDSAARVCGLMMTFEKDKLVFQKFPKRTPPKPPAEAGDANTASPVR